MCVIKDRVEALLAEQGDGADPKVVSAVAQSAASSLGDKVVSICNRPVLGRYRIETENRGSNNPIIV